MISYVCIIKKKPESYGEFLGDNFIIDEALGIKYLIAVAKETDTRIKCVFITKAENEDANYVARINVQNRKILYDAIIRRKIQIESFSMISNCSNINIARLLLSSCIHYYPEDFEETNKKQILKNIDAMSYITETGSNLLLRVYRNEFLNNKFECVEKKDTEEFAIEYDNNTWSYLSADYIELNKMLEKKYKKKEKNLPYSFVFIMKNIDKFSECIIEKFNYELYARKIVSDNEAEVFNFNELIYDKVTLKIMSEKDYELDQNRLVVIRMPYEYYRVYKHSDEGSKDPTFYRDIDMSLFDQIKDISNAVNAMINCIKNKPSNTVVVFLCDNEIDYDKNGLFSNELKDCPFKIINFNEILSDKIKDYYEYKLTKNCIDTSFADDLVNNYENNVNKGLITTNIRILDANFDRWHNLLMYKNREMSESTYRELKDNSKTGKELLAEMVGETKVKKQLEKICANFEVQKIREYEGCKKVKTNKHMFFLGNPGTGKTEMARIIAKILYEKGIINNERIVEVGVDELTSQWVGHTEDLCKARIEEAIGGILFIDEAYALMNEHVGKNAIDVLVKEMENNRDKLIVIMAGYKEQMKQLLEVNVGLKSRIAKIVDFDDFTIEELMDIAKKIAESHDYYINKNGLKVLKKILQKEKESSDFGNGRIVRTIIEMAIENQSLRIRPLLENYSDSLKNKKNNIISMELLKELTEKDFKYEADELQNNYVGFVTKY